ncbi:MFS transporter [Subtercola sp. PAMC28395]|uniref:MFS transporter n=1 Tax=Subtercola sp. PAMC28395 TaxID=2846775 RepID=UPI001C0E3463|nr:MFS transporter [Subtercola sp. PAMC28395]QWT25435.1 MFS transporter [Subtercola sp. PAMC28395]
MHSFEPRLRRSRFVDLTPLRQSPAFARLWAGGAISGIGGQMTIVAVGLHIYSITQSTFAVSLVGVFALVPMIVFGLYGGVLADTFDRRVVALVSAIVAWVSTATLAALAWLQVDTVWPFYVLATVVSVAATVIGATRSSIVPRLLPPELLPAASALNGISMGAMITVGPALAGVLVATAGIQWTYTVDVVLFVAAFVGIFSLPKIIPEGTTGRAGISAVLDGVEFLKGAPNVRMSFIVDIVAMTFGQPRVLFPAVGAVLIGGGAITVGILTASAAAGALLCSLLSGRLGHVRWQGRAVQRAIVVYGACIAAFGAVLLVASIGSASPGVHSITESFGDANGVALVLAALFLAGSGAADNVSAIFRTTILQSAVPDVMRGRIQGVFTVVVAGGPRLGDAYIGVLATVAAVWFPPLLGGIVIMVLVTILVRASAGFRGYDAQNPLP